MRLTTTLNKYLAKNYIINLLILVASLSAITYLFDTVELIRRASKRPDVPLSLILHMSLLKLPDVMQTLLPFAVLFSSMYTFWQLTRRYELIVIRASGFSVWQFLAPIAAVALLTGILQMTVINPIGSIFVGKFQQLERQHLGKGESHIAVFQEGLWLRQPVLFEQNTDPTYLQKQTENISEGKNEITSLEPGYVILNAQKIKQPEWLLSNVTILFFKDNSDFVQRVNAKEAFLKSGKWELKDVLLYFGKDAIPRKLETYELPTSLTRDEIEESFASPQSMSFWKLPAYIQTLEETGFDAKRLRVYYQKLLAQPLLFAAMVLLAATVSMRPPRTKGAFFTISVGVFAGFLIFFLSSFLQALGATGQIPIILSAWSPSVISLLLGLSILLSKEDG